jgi:hypothetical protein
MSAPPAARWLSVLAFALASGTSEAQGMAGAGAYLGVPVFGFPLYGGPVYGVPVYGAPWLWPNAGVGAWHYADRAPGIAPSCLRVGRCTVAELEIYYRTPYVLERRAPTAPEETVQGLRSAYVFGPGVAPTADEAVRPEYREASLPWEKYSESGKPLER